MTEAQALSRLNSMLAVEDEPTLSDAELQELLAMAARADEYGRSIEEAAWKPTYNLAAAAAQGWRWKAGKAAGNYTFSADGASFSRDQIHSHCLAMAQHYEAQAGIVSIQVASRLGYNGFVYPVVGNL